MYALWVLIVCGAIAGVYGLVDVRYLGETPQLGAVGFAQRMSTYRQALVAYAIANPGFAGSASAASLAPFAAGMTLDPSLRNFVVPNSDAPGSLVVVYTTSTAMGGAIAQIETLAGGSAMAGVAHGGSVLSPGNPAVPLPVAIAAAVPDGTPVWMAQAWQPPAPLP